MKPNNHEKLNCSGDVTAPIKQSKSPTTAPPASSKDKPLKRLVSKYSPSGAGTICERSLISFAPPDLVQVWSPAAWPQPFPVSPALPLEHQQQRRSDCAARRARN